MAYSMIRDRNGEIPKLRMIDYSGKTPAIGLPFVPKNWAIDCNTAGTCVRIDGVEYPWYAVLTPFDKPWDWFIKILTCEQKIKERETTNDKTDI